MINVGSFFTTSGHYVLLEGINEKGNIIVRDPNGVNYYDDGSDLSKGLGIPAPNKENGGFDATKPFKLAEEGERIHTSENLRYR